MQIMNTKNRNSSISQNFTTINVYVKNVIPKMTIREVSKLFRQDLNQKIKNGSLFSAYQSQFDSDFIYVNKNSSIVDISNIQN